MTDPRPPDPDPQQSPDLDSGGSPTGPQTPDSDSTSLQSDSATSKQGPLDKQSPPPKASNKSAYVWLAVTAIFVLLVVAGLVGYMFELV